MNKLLQWALLATALSVTQSCKENETTSIEFTGTMKPVFVNSGSISDLNYAANPENTFRIEDGAIGYVYEDILCGEANALKDDSSNVYIFAEGKLPDARDQKLFTRLVNLEWKLVKSYKLELDALVLEDEFKYYFEVREAGDYPIYESTLDGKPVYKYLDTKFIEDYSKLAAYHELQKPNAELPVLIDQINGIKEPSTYSIRVGASGLPRLTSDGKVDYFDGAATAMGETDKIYFIQEGAVVNYRLRHVYRDEKFSKSVQKFYDRDGKALSEFERVNNPDNELLKTTRAWLLNNHNEKQIKGYSCDKNSNQLKMTLGGPPPPIC